MTLHPNSLKTNSIAPPTTPMPQRAGVSKPTSTPSEASSGMHKGCLSQGDDEFPLHTKARLNHHHCFHNSPISNPVPSKPAGKICVAPTESEFTYRAAQKMQWSTWPEQQVDDAGVIWKMLLGNEGAENGNAMAMGIARIRPGQKLDLHHHRAPEIYYLLGGAGTVEIDGHSVSAKAGEAYFLPGNAPHVSQASDDEYLEFAFFFPYQSFNQVEYHMQEPRAPMSASQPETHPHRIPLNNEVWQTLNDDLFGKRCFGKRTIPAGQSLKISPNENLTQAFVVSGNGILQLGSKYLPLEAQSAVSLCARSEKCFVNPSDEPLVILLISNK